jgi:hypothetical protein
MSAKVKGQTSTLHASGECVAGKTGFACGPDCDGGGVNVDLDARTGGILISFDKLSPRIRMTIGCGGEEDDTVDLTPGADDKVFRLERAALSACRPLDRRF